jgi:hypothetical protein
MNLLTYRAALANGLVVIAVATTLLAPPRAVLASDFAVNDAGGTYLSWWACAGDAQASSAVSLDCAATGGAVYTLVGTFTPTVDVPHAVSMSADLNIAFTGSSVPPFWSIDALGCNASAFNLLKGMPAACAGNVNAFCAGDSNQCDLLYAASAVAGAGVMRVSITVARGIQSAVPLVAGQRYFAFALNIPMEGAAGCTGCTAAAAVGFNKGTIYSIDDNGQALPPITVTGWYPGAVPCATANGGTSACAKVPAQRLSWGRLKSLYR